MGELRVLRRASALVLGIEAVPDHHPDEMPAAWCRADPKTGEREVAGEMLAHARRVRAPRPGLTLIGDKGFAGQESGDLATAGSGLRPVRPGRRGQAPRHGSAGWIRQAIESVNDTLDQLDLGRHGGRTGQGVFTLVARRLLAMAVCTWHDRSTGAPVTRSLIAYHH